MLTEELKQNLTMKKIILIGGELACGKSTYADTLGQALHVTTIHKDHLKEILGERLTANNRAENLVLSDVCFDMEQYLIERTQTPLIVEANFKSHEIAALLPVLNESQVLSLCFSGDPTVLHQRYLARDAERNPIHKSRDLYALSDFIAAQKELRAVVYPGTVICVDATSFAYQQDQELLAQVQRFLTEDG